VSNFNVQLDKHAEKHLRKLRKTPAFDGISEALLEMEHDPFAGDLKKLQGEDMYRRRVGKYRILFEVDADLSLVSVYGILKREDAYRLF
jgi:mRNA interferase RelE/StbE